MLKKILILLLTLSVLIINSQASSAYSNYRFRVTSIYDDQFSMVLKRLTPAEKEDFNDAYYTLIGEKSESEALAIINGKTAEEFVVFMQAQKTDKPKKSEISDLEEELGLGLGGYPAPPKLPLIVSYLAIPISALIEAALLFLVLKITKYYSTFRQLYLVSFIAYLLYPIPVVGSYLTLLALYLLLNRVTSVPRALLFPIIFMAAAFSWLFSGLVFMIWIANA